MVRVIDFRRGAVVADTQTAALPSPLVLLHLSSVIGSRLHHILDSSEISQEIVFF